MVFPFVPGKVDTSDPTVARTPWDIVQLGQFTLPGISTVRVHRSRKSRVKSPKDQSYATIKDSGLDLARVVITNVIAYPSQLDSLEQILKYINTELGVKVVKKTTRTANGESITSSSINGFAVNHPALQANGINSIYVEEIEGPIATRPGFITTTFNCIEVRDIKNTGTAQVDQGKSFAQGSAFSNTPNVTPTPPSKNTNATGPRR